MNEDIGYRMNAILSHQEDGGQPFSVSPSRKMLNEDERSMSSE